MLEDFQICISIPLRNRRSYDTLSLYHPLIELNYKAILNMPLKADNTTSEEQKGKKRM